MLRSSVTFYAVGIATGYGLDGQGIESRWGARFSAPVQTGRGAHPASCTICTGSSLGVKRPGRGVDHPPPSSAEGKERVELYLYSPLWAFVAYFRVNFTFYSGVMLTTHLHFVPNLRVGGTVPLLPLHVLMTWTGTTLPFL